MSEIKLDNRSIEELSKELVGPIAVFGAGGFIGANIAHELSKTRQDIYPITHQTFVPWRLTDLPQRCIVRCDINNQDEVRDIFRTYKFKTVLFFAAYGAYAKQTDAALIYQTNILGLLNVLLAAEEQGLEAMVHAGSQSEYGTNCSGSEEDWSLVPNSHYAVSKISASYLINFWGKQKNIPIVNLRLYSAYGPWEEPDRLIPNVIDHGLKKKYPPFVNPDISRDFVYVEDIVRATLLAALRGVHNAKGDSINIASGVKTTIREVANISKEIFQISSEPNWGSMPNRAWDLIEWYGNPNKAKQLLGWQATTSFKDGLIKYTQWVKQNPDTPKVYQPVDIDSPVRISAIIACYKDAQAIPIMYKRLTDTFKSLRIEYEIIFVNDASPDNTDEVARAIASKDPRVIVIEHSRNFGSQSAFLSGMHVATGNAVVLMDGDLQDPPELISEFFKKWHNEGFDVVYGRRVKREATLFMSLAYKAFYRAFRGISEIPIPLDAGDFSLIDRKVVNQLLLLPETDQFLRGLRAWVGFKQTGVDYVRPERMFGVSTNNLRKNFRWARKGIFSFSYAPLEYLLFGGIGLTIIAALAFAFTIALRFIDPSVPRGVTTVVALILGFGGIQLLAISILGEYIAKILDETKKRPKYIVRTITNGSKYLSSSSAVQQFLQDREKFREVTS
jgi:nucleoside-diphosphate-sugar epimerase/glycosyltransferase involved in cell wall biosynthesis